MSTATKSTDIYHDLLVDSRPSNAKVDKVLKATGIPRDEYDRDRQRIQNFIRLHRQKAEVQDAMAEKLATIEEVRRHDAEFAQAKEQYERRDGELEAKCDRLGNFIRKHEDDMRAASADFPLPDCVSKEILEANEASKTAVKEWEAARQTLDQLQLEVDIQQKHIANAHTRTSRCDLDKLESLTEQFELARLDADAKSEIAAELAPKAVAIRKAYVASLIGDIDD